MVTPSQLTNLKSSPRRRPCCTLQGQPRQSRLSFLRPWLLLLICSLFAWLYTANQARAWFSAVANWQQIYIAYVNDADVCPVYHPEVVTEGWPSAYDSALKTYWHFDGDLNGAIGSNLTPQGAGTYSLELNGKSGGYLNADGYPGYFDTTAAPFGATGISGTGGFVVALWMRSPETVSVGDTKYLFSCGSFQAAEVNEGGVIKTALWVTGSDPLIISDYPAAASNWALVVFVAARSKTLIYIYDTGSTRVSSPGVFTGPLAAPTGAFSLGYSANSLATDYDETGVWWGISFASDQAITDFVDDLWKAGAGSFYGGTPGGTASAYVDAAEAGTVSLPITFRCAIRTLGGESAITSAKIQYKATGTGVWTDLTPAYAAPSWAIDFFPTMTAFGLDSATTSVYAKGATMLFRLYVSDGVAENADPAQDTTADGTNGWLDQWVVGATAHATNTKPARPSQ